MSHNTKRKRTPGHFRFSVPVCNFSLCNVSRLLYVSSLSVISGLFPPNEVKRKKNEGKNEKKREKNDEDEEHGIREHELYLS